MYFVDILLDVSVFDGCVIGAMTSQSLAIKPGFHYSS